VEAGRLVGARLRRGESEVRDAERLVGARLRRDETGVRDAERLVGARLRRGESGPSLEWRRGGWSVLGCVAARVR
jgi:hypothetical protein